MYPALLESIGTSELLLVLASALVLVGPRKLPGLASSLGRAMGQVRSATDSLKNAWETEAQALNAETAGRAGRRRVDAARAPSPSTSDEDSEADANESGEVGKDYTARV